MQFLSFDTRAISVCTSKREARSVLANFHTVRVKAAGYLVENWPFAWHLCNLSRLVCE